MGLLGKGALPLAAVLLGWSLATAVAAAEWGRIMTPPAKANIRAGRSAESALRGQILPGERVKVDFLQDQWYALFPVEEKRRDEAFARGYVYAPLLREAPATAAAQTAPGGRPSSQAKPPAGSPWPWGKLMVAPARINIRAGRSVESALRGQVLPGETIKVDFLQGQWYALFPAEEERRDEAFARGYVYAPLLRDPAPQASPKPRTEAAASPSDLEKKGLLVTLLEMAVQSDEAGKERFHIRFDRFTMPRLSGVEGERPQIVLEISNAAGLPRQSVEPEPGGALIRKVQGHWDPRTRKIRIVLEMAPQKNYFVKPLFFEESNAYCLEITEDTPAPGGP